MLTLDGALRLSPATAPALAIVGAGGKTTVLFELARALRPSVVTATTHLGAWQVGLATRHVVGLGADALGSGAPPSDPVLLVTGRLDPTSRRFQGLPADEVDRLIERASAVERPVLVEADGSRQRPLKAPAAHEPPIPTRARHVLVVAGLSALGRPLGDATVHRPELYAAIAGRRLGDPLDDEALVSVLVHPQGGLKNVPQGARRVALLNQADTLLLRAAAGRAAGRLLGPFDAVVVASLRPPEPLLPDGTAAGTAPRIHAVHEQVAAIVLAAGGASRFGLPKPLLDLGGRPFVRAVAESAIAAGLSPVLVVTGAGAERVRRAVDGLGVACTHNAHWAAGQSTSVAAGIAALPAAAGAAVFLLADQPLVPPSVLRALVARHAETLGPAVAPFVNGVRTAPALFDRALLGRLASVTGDRGGRGLLDQVRVQRVDWPDPRVFLDVDTPDDYRRLLEAAGQIEEPRVEAPDS